MNSRLRTSSTNTPITLRRGARGTRFWLVSPNSTRFAVKMTAAVSTIIPIDPRQPMKSAINPPPANPISGTIDWTIVMVDSWRPASVRSKLSLMTNTIARGKSLKTTLMHFTHQQKRCLNTKPLRVSTFMKSWSKAKLFLQL